MGNWKLKCGEVKAMHVNILEECGRQSFTRREFSRLIYLLQKSDSNRGVMLLDEMIIPPEERADLSNNAKKE